LEVLKLLQKSYLGKIKMIYIDPPYNTGNDFIYPDNFSESLQRYLEYTGQVDAEGRKFGTNTEADGRFHSRWLNMMYPRLYLARNLLREDGAIFVSCDDNEFQNLRVAMNEVFGEENFIASVIWQKVYSPKNSAKHFSADHDYIVVYGRRGDIWRPELLPRNEEMEARYDNTDNDPRGPWKAGDLSARNYYSEGTYPITCPSGRVIEGPPPGNYWRVSKEKFLEMDQDGRIWWGKDGNNVPAIKRFLTEVRQGRVPQTLWPYSEVGHTQDAKKELMEYVAFEHTDNVLDSVKPVALIRRMLQLATRATNGDIVLDFFGGSGPTGHAVIAQNAEDGGNRGCNANCVNGGAVLLTPRQ
jgi:adenine-specific DNA-methyltransferase